MWPLADHDNGQGRGPRCVLRGHEETVRGISVITRGKKDQKGSNSCGSAGKSASALLVVSGGEDSRVLLWSVDLSNANGEFMSNSAVWRALTVLFMGESHDGMH